MNFHFECLQLTPINTLFLQDPHTTLPNRTLTVKRRNETESSLKLRLIMG
jgi:hypothetical protein